MILFTIGSIPLIEMIKDNNKITGHITKGIKPIKVQSYADDMTIIINTPNEINEISSIFDKHSLASEAKINKEKTQAFAIGNRFPREPETFKNIIQDNVKILGSTFCRDKRNETANNLEKANKILDNLIKTNFNSLLGKILMLHSYVYSTIWHTAYLIDTSSTSFHLFEKKNS